MTEEEFEKVEVGDILIHKLTNIKYRSYEKYPQGWSSFTSVRETEDVMGNLWHIRIALLERYTWVNRIKKFFRFLRRRNERNNP